MKFVFLCGSLEPGRDGIGDYTRKLADELSRQNHIVAMIALYDRHLTNDSIECVGDIDCQSIQTLRLSDKLPWKKKLVKINQLLKIVNPDWISLQYGPYSFQDKGIPLKLSSHLKYINKNYKWHVMFHETWVGIKKDSPLTHIIYGFLQKKIAKCLINDIKPAYISTNNVIYQLILKEENILSDILLLFSNISLITKDNAFITKFYKNLNIPVLNINNYRYVGFFGSMYHSNLLEQVINIEINAARTENKQLVFIVFGRIGDWKKYEHIKAAFADKIKISYLGELSERHVSTILQILDIGMLGTPREYLSKSGVYAAMRRHNLNIVSTSSMILSDYKHEVETFNLLLEELESFKWDVKYIAKQFYENISMHTNLQSR